MQHPNKLRSPIACAFLPALAWFGMAASASAAGLCDNLSQAECRAIASRNVYALLGNNVIVQLYGSKVLFQSRIDGVEGNLIGIDFRPNQQANAVRTQTVGLHGLSDTGKIYTIAIGPGGGQGTATLVSAPLVTPFDGGFQSLLDFNPVVDAIRLIGSNDQNFAVVNSGGNLNASAVQTAVAYAAGDTQAGRDPNLTGGAYTNNVAGAANTIFYALDYARDNLVTIATITNGSSATGGGQLKTLGRLVDRAGNAINILPDAGIDIFTDQSIGNGALIANGQTLYFLNLATVNPNQALGTTRDVVLTELTDGLTPFLRALRNVPGTYMDVAASPVTVLPNPADLASALAINLAGFTEGQPRTYEVTVTNQGPDSESGVFFSATFLPFKNPVVTTTLGTCTLNVLTVLGRTFSCNLGTLAPGASATIRTTVSRVADQFAGDAQLTSNFNVTGSDGFIALQLVPGDPDGTNNAISSTVTFNR